MIYDINHTTVVSVSLHIKNPTKGVDLVQRENHHHFIET
jgi:hypothetical protein